MSQITVLTGPERHRRWREDERQTILAAAFAPGASVAEVARRYDVATSLIYKWRQNAASASDGEASFVPAMVVSDLPPPPEAGDSTAISLELAGGTRVSISPRAPASLVTAVLRALQ